MLTKLNVKRLIGIFKACLLSNLDAIKAAALKQIEFLVDNLGCSIGNENLPALIEALIVTYPKHDSSIFVQKGQRVVVESFTASTESTVVPNLQKNMDKISDFLALVLNPNSGIEQIEQERMNFRVSYNHIFESLLSLLPSCT